jgi:hypothetical protein
VRGTGSGPAKLCLMLVALLATTPSPADAVQVIAGLSVEAHPRSSIASTLNDEPATEASVLVVEGSAVLPLVVRSDRALFAPIFSASRVGVSVHPLDPERDAALEALYDLHLNLVVSRELSNEWWMTAIVSPGIASDLRRLDRGHLTFQAAAFATHRVQSNLVWGLGGSATNAFGESAVIPLVALEWVGSHTRADLLLPARAAVLWRVGARAEIGVVGNLSGNVYALGREGELRDAVVRYSVVNLGGSALLGLTPWLELVLSGGTSLARRLEIEDARGVRIHNARMDPGFSFSAGLSILSPRIDEGPEGSRAAGSPALPHVNPALP